MNNRLSIRRSLTRDPFGSTRRYSNCLLNSMSIMSSPSRFFSTEKITWFLNDSALVRSWVICERGDDIELVVEHRHHVGFVGLITVYCLTP